MRSTNRARPELSGSYGMVSSTHWLATASGMAILEQGGNAFDAAVASGLVLEVVEPHMNGPGGEAPMLAYLASEERVEVVNGQGPAPADASVERYRDLGLDLVPGSGQLAACVPGAFDAWMVILLRHGSMTLRSVLGHAITYAQNGFPVLPEISRAIEEVEGLFRKSWTSSGEVYLRAGTPRPGAVLRNPRLSQTFLRILQESESVSSDRDKQIQAARNCYYRGFVADALIAFSQGANVVDTSGEAHCGLLCGDDMVSFEASVEQPVFADYRGHRVFKTRPWGQGPVFLQQLRLLEGLDLGAAHDLELVHTVTECAKLAFADREAYYGDPAWTPVPLEILLSSSYAAERRGLVSQRASLELRPGQIDGREPRIPSPDGYAAGGRAGTGDPAARLGAAASDTCHVDVVDRWGNMISATPSGGWLQSAPVVPELGFPLGTRAQMFWLDDGHPNSLEGGKRPRTTLSPSLAVAPDGTRVAFGTPGGDQQDQWSLMVFLQHVDRGLSLQEAIEAPRWHTEHFPSSFYPRDARPGSLVLEEPAAESLAGDLHARGHDVTTEPASAFGRVCAVAFDPSRGEMRAGADPRGQQAYAAGR
jgi:gamma-glutamyltranspeptidase / glutathione hydrolase